jgi:DNA polymerase-3 subunit beta
MSRESYPELPQMPPRIAEIPAGILASLISRTVFVISNEESRFTLNGALLSIKPGRVTIVATDGHRLSMTEKDISSASEEQTSFRALLPKKAMGEIIKLCQDLDPAVAVEFSGNENHLFFRVGDRLLISRKLTGNFPDYERVLPQDHSHSVSLSRDELRATIERVSQFSDERSHAIRLRFAPGELKVFSSLSDTGETEENLSLNYDGAKIEVGFNAQYLAEFLRAVPENTVTLGFKDAGSAGELQPAGESVNYVYRYVVMPMRI